MEQNEIAVFQQSIETCKDPAEIARKVKRTFKRMPGEMALACFAKVMTAELPHPIKVAVWDAVRYSHIWWGVDAVLQGPVMENPIVQQAFADAVPMRRWIVDNQRPGYEPIQFTISKNGSIPSEGGFACPFIERELLRLGVDPNHYNNLGLCWNDIARHVVRPV